MIGWFLDLMFKLGLLSVWHAFTSLFYRPSFWCHRHCYDSGWRHGAVTGVELVLALLMVRALGVFVVRQLARRFDAE